MPKGYEDIRTRKDLKKRAQLNLYKHLKEIASEILELFQQALSRSRNLDYDKIPSISTTAFHYRSSPPRRVSQFRVERQELLVEDIRLLAPQSVVEIDQYRSVVTNEYVVFVDIAVLDTQSVQPTQCFLTKR